MTRFSTMSLRETMLGATLLLAACGGGGSSSGGNGSGGNPPPPPPPAVSVAVTPQTASIFVSANQQFNCQVSNSTNTQCTWAVQEQNGGTVSASGLYTAPANPGTYHVIATAAADSTKKATATITVTQAIALIPAAQTLPSGGKQSFVCTVTSQPDEACNFTADAGSVTPTGVYTAPTAPGSYLVTATAASDPSKKITATVTVDNTPPKAWVTGYYAGYFWENMFPPEEVDMRAMTHFVFARIAPGGGSLGGTPGNIVQGGGSAHEKNPFAPDPNVPVEDWMIARAHEAGTKALVMFGGDGGDGVGFNLSSSDALRPGFVKKVVDYLVAHNYDGIDMDWENRLLDGCSAEDCGVAIDGQESVRRLVQLTKDIRAEANSRPRYQNNPIIITFAHYVKKKGEDVEAYQAEMGQIVDQYNMMSYGVGSTWFGAGWASWFTSPITGAYWADSEHVNMGNAPVDLDSSIAAYVAAGIPRNRIGIGIGFYGVPYGAPITGPRQPTDGINAYFSINDLPWAYFELKDGGYLDTGTYKWDQPAQSAYRTYAGNGYSPAGSGREPITYLSYENGESIHAKGKYVIDTGAGGTIIWLLNYGYTYTRPDGKRGTNTLLADVKCAFLQRNCPGPMTP